MSSCLLQVSSRKQQTLSGRQSPSLCMPAAAFLIAWQPLSVGDRWAMAASSSWPPWLKSACLAGHLRCSEPALWPLWPQTVASSRLWIQTCSCSSGARLHCPLNSAGPCPSLGHPPTSLDACGLPLCVRSGPGRQGRGPAVTPHPRCPSGVGGSYVVLSGCRRNLRTGNRVPSAPLAPGAPQPA